MIGRIISDLFGPGTWGTGGNLVASAILTVPAVIVSHLKAARQRERHHEELKRAVTEAATPRPESEGR